MAHPLGAELSAISTEPAPTYERTKWSGWQRLRALARVTGKIAAGIGIVLLLVVVGLFTLVAQPYWPMVFGVVGIAGLIALAAWLSKRFAVVLAALLILLTGLITASQVTASTPAIKDAQGKVVPGSIAEMRTVNLGGVDQWITIRGRDVNNPILLNLSGGPGETTLVGLRLIQPRLEDRLVVVNWDQRGAGKSAGVLYADYAHMTPQQYVQDGLQLTSYLRQRFHRDKIYLEGASWGTLLGVWMVQRHPEWYQAYIGISQVVNWAEMERLEYQYTLDYARKAGDTQVVKTLEANGPPPYRGDPLTVQRKDSLDLNAHNLMYMPKLVKENGGTQGAIDPTAGSEFGVADKVNYLAGFMLTFARMYEQLLQVDLTTQAPRLDVPVYFASGRLDINTPQSTTERYYNLLQAPHKELVWFERSGHTIVLNQPAELDDFMFRVLAQTSGPGT